MADEDKALDTSTDFSSFLAKTGLQTGEQVKKEREKAFEAYKEKRAPLLAEQDRMMKMMEDINTRMQSIKAPKTPELSNIGAQPNTEYRDPTQALGGIASVLALLGSMKTRAPLTAALNSAAASMKGFHEGDKERAKLEREKWQDNLYKGLQQNQIEMQKYMAALKEADFDVSKAQQAFRLISAENDHVAMKSAIEAGDYNAQMAILDAGLKANHEAAKLWITDQEKRAQIDALKDYRKTLAGARVDQKIRDESFKARAEYRKRIDPVDKSITGLDGAEVLLRGATPGEKIMGARALQRVVGGSERLKLDASQMQNFGDIVTRIEGWVSKGIWGELTDAQYQQLLSGVQSLRQKEQARKKAIEDDTRNLVTSANLDSGIVFGEGASAPAATVPAPPGAKDLDHFLGRP